mgnify:CR=1 FL=1
MYTIDQLNKLKAAYASGVLQVRDGNDYVEYQSMQQMRIAISDMEAELNVNNNRNNPKGTRLVKVSKGYY